MHILAAHFCTPRKASWPSKITGGKHISTNLIAFRREDSEERKKLNEGTKDGKRRSRVGEADVVGECGTQALSSRKGQVGELTKVGFMKKD